MLWFGSGARPGNYNLRLSEYTYPVYYADQATGLFPVQTRWRSNLDGQQIPWNPEWRPAPGTDAQAIVIDQASGREWNLFQVQQPFDGIVRATNGNLIPGDFRTRTTGFVPSRGVGIPYLAMLVRPEEISAGKIAHALSLPIKNTSGQYYVPPATKLEFSHGRAGIPEGMRFALDVSDEEIEAWLAGLNVPPKTKRAARIIAVAIRDYGWFVTDVSGDAGFQFESSVSARGKWAAVGLGQLERGYTEYPRDLLDGLITRDRIYTLVDSNSY